MHPMYAFYLFPRQTLIVHIFFSSIENRYKLLMDKNQLGVQMHDCTRCRDDNHAFLWHYISFVTMHLPFFMYVVGCVLCVVYVVGRCTCVEGTKGGSRPRAGRSSHSSGLLDNGQSAHSHSRRLPRQPEGTHRHRCTWRWRCWWTWTCMDFSACRWWRTVWRSASSQVQHNTTLYFHSYRHRLDIILSFY